MGTSGNKIAALQVLTEQYKSRTAHRDAVRAKYARYDEEMAEATQRDIDDLAQAVVDAWAVGNSVAATGRALGTTNIYAARRVVYERAKELAGKSDGEESAAIQELYNQAFTSTHEGRGINGKKPDFDTRPDVMGPVTPVEEEVPDPENLREWVESWTLEYVDDSTTKVHDPQERVESIRLGFIQGFKDKGNLAEFMKDKELADIVNNIHGIETKVTA